ncbi:MAG: 50S ribosomal protein L11 methyltransferase [Actinomycetota bacterium]
MGWILRVQLDTTTLDLASAVLWDAGTSGVAHLADDPSGPSGMSGVVAGFDTEAEASAAADRLRSSLGAAAVAGAAVEPVDPSAWADPDRRVAATVAGYDLVLAPGAAFGDGGHPTTTLSLELLAALDADHPVGGRTVVDFGTGTGVLTLAALAHGAAEVVAVENDPAAVEAATATLALNPGLTGGRRVDVLTELPPEPEPAAAVLVNVLLPVHRAWGVALQRWSAPDGGIVVSGILVDQEDAVRACYPDLSVMERRREGDWLGLLLAPADRRRAAR